MRQWTLSPSSVEVTLCSAHIEHVRESGQELDLLGSSVLQLCKYMYIVYSKDWLTSPVRVCVCVCECCVCVCVSVVCVCVLCRCCVCV